MFFLTLVGTSSSVVSVISPSGLDSLAVVPKQCFLLRGKLGPLTFRPSGKDHFLLGALRGYKSREEPRICHVVIPQSIGLEHKNYLKYVTCEFILCGVSAREDCNSRVRRGTLMLKLIISSNKIRRRLFNVRR